MKKIVITAAVVACAGIVSAQVYSQNVVGYSKQELAPGFTMIHVPFDEGGSPISIQDLLDTSLLTQGASLTAADKIQLWDNVGLKYDTFWLSNGVDGKVTDPAKVGKWIDASSGLVATDTIGPGTGFFFQKVDSTANVMFMGEAVDSATGTNTLTLLEGFNMVANPFTSEFGLNTTVTNWIEQGAVASASLTGSDQILLWDNVGLKYDTFWLSNGVDGKVTDPDKVGKWIDDATGLVASNNIPLNTAFFYTRKAGAGTLSLEVEQPYNLGQ